MTNNGEGKGQKWVRHGATFFAAITFIAPFRLAAAQAPSLAQRDLTPTIIHHETRCPAPGQGKCVIRKPVGTGYRVLTPGLDLEDAGDHWIADFAKTRSGRTPQTLLRIMDRHEVLHEIEITFPSEPAASAAPAGKPAAAAKSAPAKKKPGKAKKQPAKAKKQVPAAPGN